MSAVQEAKKRRHQVTCEYLARDMEPGSRWPRSAGADDEVGIAGLDGSDEMREIGDDVAAIAIHEDEDVTGCDGGVCAGFAGGAVTSS